MSHRATRFHHSTSLVRSGVGLNFRQAGNDLSLCINQGQACSPIGSQAEFGAVSTALGFIAVIAGWVTTEVGRQPWTVYGLLRTADSVSPSLTGSDVAISLAFYVIVYLVMFSTGIAFMRLTVATPSFFASAAPMSATRWRPRSPNVS